MSNDKNVGDVLRLTVNFARTVAVAGAVDPDVVTLTVDKPTLSSLSWTVQNGQIIRDSLGVYHADVPLDEGGLWRYRWVGTGANASAEEGAFAVQPVVAT